MLAVPARMLNIAGMTVFFLPLPVAVSGIIIGLKCKRNGIGSTVPLIGILLNSLWLLGVAFAFYVLFVVGVHV